MKTLTKIRLINWHNFENETIDVKGNVLLTGENGCGKSTILDAISYVITAGDQKFNLAANEKGKRDLRSYVKCKLGSLDQEYLRDYDLTGHICLEFYSEKQEKYFCLGAVIDVIGNIQPVKTIFYIVDSPMKEEFFINENYEIKSISDFKKSKITSLIFSTNKEAKSAFRNKMGGISDKYYTLLPKAVAFKPISDVKEYIYQHLLEQKNIDVENIQDSIRSYKEFETILKTTKNKIEDLNKISNNYYMIKEIKENQDFYEYLLKDIYKNDNELLITKKSKEAEKIEKEVFEITKGIAAIDQEKQVQDDKSKELYASLSQNKEFRANELYDKEIKSCESGLQYAQERKREFDRKLVEYKDAVKSISDVDKKLYSQLSKLSQTVDDSDAAMKFEQDLRNIDQALDERKESLTRRETEVEMARATTYNKIHDVYNSLTQLSKNSLPYKPEIVELRRQMEEYLAQTYNERISVHVLAEILEIKDPSWQDTIEDFLGNQRFTLIVEPKYYDDCLYVYNEYKSKRLFGINLLNTKKIQGFDSYQPNSLASIITTENIDARHYVNYLLGNIIMVSDIKDLEKYSSAITKSGMLYRGFVTRYLNPNTEKPFIGSIARQKQNEKFQKLGESLKVEYQEYSNELSKIKEIRDVILSLPVAQFKSLISDVSDSFALKAKLEELKEKKKHLSLTGVNDLRCEYERIIEGIRTLEQKKSSEQIRLGTKKQAINSINEEIENIILENKQIDLEIKSIEEAHIDYEMRAKQLFEKEREAGKSAKEISQYYQKEIESQMSNLKSLESGLQYTQLQYISKYNRPFGTGYDHGEEYLDELDKLVKSELVKYENKVRESREEAEKLFKEDFLSKLRSYIMEAQDEISKINETLDKIVFGRDKYQFIFPKSKEFGAIYDMITDEIDGKVGYSIFDEEFEKKYNQELDELFTNLAQDEEGSEGNLNKYTDYRTYMDYDIKIMNDTDVFYFSNISKVRSGAETQIPFYVAILASFVRLFDKAEKNGLDDSIGLIMFDEVFDKMDAKRQDAMMDFIDRLNVQIMLACPPEKIKTLSNHTETTVNVVREGKYVKTFEIMDKAA